MFYINLFELVTQTIVESLAFTFTATVFLKVKIRKPTILTIGLINGILIYLIRKIPMAFGFHTIFSIFFMTVLLYYFYSKSSLNCFIVSLKVFIILTIFELFFSYSILFLTDINIDLIQSKPYIKTLVMLPQIIFLFLTGFFIWYKQNLKGD